ncbi:unnamed protein product [Mycena citricolor]|uniref:RRM domain-containing protein n=1 Tax=Mycena citricolor TaxID=2018698 RepID=A0AAD2HT35_9AGAR|nr:unnamed protein product [Mycena citricolor]
MSEPKKLTKRQKKGLAFRSRKSNPADGADPDSALGLEDNEVPVLEVQDLIDEEAVPAVGAGETRRGSNVKGKASAGKEKGKGKGKEKEKANESVPPTSKKRKRDSDAGELGAEVDENEPAKSGEPKKKKAKKPAGATAGDDVPENSKTKQRFILFVEDLGNLKYTTTAEAIKAHFAICDPPPTVRLRTPKPSASGRPIVKSKGCAFVEFSHRNALQQGLKLHQSELEGRKINVELTVGGGGKSDSRLGKLKERNKGLFEQRKDRVEKLAKQDPTLSAIPDLPQRFSATSGLEQVHSKRKTWTVGDEDDDGPTHRGGKKHVKIRGKPKKPWATGTNAIPVG